MVQRLTQLFFLLALSACLSTVASADQIGVGLLTYDSIDASTSQFDITNLTGANFAPTDFPVSTLLSITVSSLTVNFTSGPALVLPGSSFSVVDSAGDVDCNGAGCNLFGDSITSAVLTGTLSPTTGLAGLPAGDTGILAAFTTTITPGCDLALVAGCDAAIINATGTTGGGGGGVTPAPEPGTLGLVGIGMIGLLFVGRRRLFGAGSRNVSTVAA
jgi:PEP-CTERM motif